MTPNPIDQAMAAALSAGAPVTIDPDRLARGGAAVARELIDACGSLVYVHGRRIRA